MSLKSNIFTPVITPSITLLKKFLIKNYITICKTVPEENRKAIMSFVPSYNKYEIKSTLLLILSISLIIGS